MEEDRVEVRSEDELTESEEEWVPRRREAAVEKGRSAGGSLPRQPGKIIYTLPSIAHVGGLVAAGSGVGMAVLSVVAARPVEAQGAVSGDGARGCNSGG